MGQQAQGSIVKIGVSIAVGPAVTAFAVAGCAGTAGIGCPLAAGAAAGMIVGLPSHLVAEKVIGHKKTGREAAFALLSGAAKGQGAVFKTIFGQACLEWHFDSPSDPRQLCAR